METLSLNVNVENLTTEERETLMKLVEKSNKKSKVWKPEYKETYWSIDSHQVFNSGWDDCEVDNKRYECGTCFKTEKEAEEELTRRKMLTKWKRLSVEAGEEENEWNGANIHRYPFFNVVTRDIACNSNTSHRHGDIYFPTEESLLAAIKELGEENVKKYILGVRD